MQPICIRWHPVGMIEENRWANLIVWDTDHPVSGKYRSFTSTHNEGNVTPAIKQIMTKGEWRFDGKGYLASRIASNPTVAEWRKRLRNAYILYGTAQVSD